MLNGAAPAPVKLKCRSGKLYRNNLRGMMCYRLRLDGRVSRDMT